MHHHEFHHKSPKAFNLSATLLSSHTIRNAISSLTMLHEGSLCGSSEAGFALTMSSVNHRNKRKTTKTFAYISK